MICGGTQLNPKRLGSGKQSWRALALGKSVVLGQSVLQRRDLLRALVSETENQTTRKVISSRTLYGVGGNS